MEGTQRIMNLPGRDFLFVKYAEASHKLTEFGADVKMGIGGLEIGE